MDTLIAWIMRAIPFGTIIMYGAMAKLSPKKCGSLNLGMPGIMYLGGFAGFASAYLYENTAANPNMALCVVISLLCAFAASMLGGLIYSFLTISLRANQNVTGLALTTFGMGVANFFGVYILNGSTATQSMVYKTFQTKLPVLPGLGIVGQTIFNYGFMVYAAIILAVILHRILNHTRIGLNLRAVGENPATADAAGISASQSTNIWPPASVQAFPGLGGLYYVLDYNQGIWATTTQIEALGWLAVALVIFTTWKPLNAIWGSTCSVCSIGSINFCRRCCVSVPGCDRLIQMVPYLVTIVVLVVTSLRKKR